MSRYILEKTVDLTNDISIYNFIVDLHTEDKIVKRVDEGSLIHFQLEVEQDAEKD